MLGSVLGLGLRLGLGSDPEGMWMVGSGFQNSGWFEPLEPLPNHSNEEETLIIGSVLRNRDLTIHVLSRSEWFGEVWQVQTTPNSRVLSPPSTF